MINDPTDANRLVRHPLLGPPPPTVRNRELVKYLDPDDDSIPSFPLK